MQVDLRHRDLGTLAGPVLVFGGPYSNLQATQALIEQASARGIRADHAICSGDVVAYGADGPGCVDAIRSWGCAVVAGNCERQLAAGAMDCGCGFEDGSACDLLSACWYGHADRTVGIVDRAWMADTPDVVTFIHAGQRCAVIHGGLADIGRFLWPVSPETEFLEEIVQIRQAIGPIDMVIAGHCGLPFVRNFGDVTWLNAGAIGLPPHDGRPMTRYAILTDGTAMIHRLSYGHAAARAAMDTAGLVQGYDKTLTDGIWPSEDVLPKVLRRG